MSPTSGPVLPGRPHPLGSRLHAGGVSFCVYSGAAERLELLLYDGVDDERPTRVIDLDPRRHRT